MKLAVVVRDGEANPAARVRAFVDFVALSMR